MRNNKNITTIFSLIVLIALTSMSCSMTPEPKGKAAFGVGSGSTRSIPSPGDIASVILSVEDISTGDVILDNHKMSLYRFNSSFISDTVNFMAGDYALTQFIVVDDSDDILFVSPLEGSAKAALVLDPLPMNFSVNSDAITNVTPEVVTISSEVTPQDYGYTEFGFSITIDPKKWETAAQINGSTVYGSNPVAGIDENGRAIVVWGEQAGSIKNLKANRYTPQAGWGTPRLLDEINNHDVGAYAITMDENGNAIVMWHQNNGTTYNLFTKRYTQGSGWQPIEVLDTMSNSTVSFKMATDGDGNSIIVWSYEGTIFAKRYVPGTGWENTTEIYTTSDGISGISLSLIPSGKAVVTWGRRHNVESAKFDPATGWGTVEIIHTSVSNSVNVKGTFTVMDEEENITVAYTYYYGVNYIRGLRYTAGSGWSGIYNISGGSIVNTTEVSIAADSFGNAMVVWREDSTTLSARYYDLEFGWQPKEIIFSGTISKFAEIVMDPFGNALVMWGGDNANFSGLNMLSKNFNPSSGWSDSYLVGANESTSVSGTLVSNYSGKAIAVWDEDVSSSVQKIKANLYN